MASLKALDLTDRHPFYCAWLRMKQRCDNPNSTQYPWYGARGINIDIRWYDFDNFYDDMWSTWQLGLTLDRKNTNLGYNKSNCRWATWKEQANNKRPYQLDSRNISGKKGVSWIESRRVWLAQAFSKGSRIHLYVGRDLEAACKARDKWEEENGKKL